MLLYTVSTHLLKKHHFFHVCYFEVMVHRIIALFQMEMRIESWYSKNQTFAEYLQNEIKVQQGLLKIRGFA